MESGCCTQINVTDHNGKPADGISESLPRFPRHDYLITRHSEQPSIPPPPIHIPYRSGGPFSLVPFLLLSLCHIKDAVSITTAAVRLVIADCCSHSVWEPHPQINKVSTASYRHVSREVDSRYNGQQYFSGDSTHDLYVCRYFGIGF